MNSYWQTILSDPNYRNLDWLEISANPNITWEIISNNSHIPWNWTGVSRNSNITKEIIKNNPNLPWNLDSVVSINKRKYTLYDYLGSGTTGEVRLAFRDDEKEFVYKRYKCCYDENGELEHQKLREISIMKMFQGTNNHLVNLEDIVLTKQSIGLVMKRYTTDLRKAINTQNLTIDEKYAITQGILNAVSFIHVNKVIHADIKPENILLNEKDGTLALCDFNLSFVFVETNDTQDYTVCSPYYEPPEIINEEPYNLKIDDWSVGVVLYELFTGESIYKNSNIQKSGMFVVNFLTENVDNLDTDVKVREAIKGLLTIDQKERWTCSKVLNELFNIQINHNVVRQSIPLKNVIEDIYEIDDFRVDNDITWKAAQIYHEISGCNIVHCLVLATKIYEIYPSNGFYLNRYSDSELEILRKMNYNLFV